MPLVEVRHLVKEFASGQGLLRHGTVVRAVDDVSLELGRDIVPGHAVEAAEQCERLSVPDVFQPAEFDDVLARWPGERRILMLDETGEAPPVAAALDGYGAEPALPWAVMVGPEGGFERRELDALRQLSFVTSAALGPRVLRADTAAIAALACWQALLGDWRTERRAVQPPPPPQP